MSVPATFVTESMFEVETILSNSSNYIETVTIKPIAAQPWLTELVIKTQLLSAKNPKEKRVKVRSFVEKEQLFELRNSLDQYLKEHFSIGGQK